MNIFLLRDYVLPVFVSLVLHALVVGLSLVNWQTSPKERIIQPRVIQAKLVALEQKTKNNTVQNTPKVIDLTVQRREEERRRAAEAEKRKKAIALKKKKEQEKKAKEKAKREQQAREKREREEAARRKEVEKEKEKQRRKDAFQEALSKEEGLLLEDQYATEAQSYIAMIARRVEDNWNRPLSARTGMKCELLIQLVPNGQVVNVELVKSSGNGAFDRSAIMAVKRVEMFPEIKDMPIEVFERHYRTFRLLFNPQDLRL